MEPKHLLQCGGNGRRLGELDPAKLQATNEGSSVAAKERGR